ncbi:MAG: amidase [Anaerolineae bacterium]
MLVHSAPLAPIAAALRSGERSLADFLEELLDRLERVEPQVQALLPEPERRARLLAEAESLHARYPTPAGRPPLYGIPFGVKDIFRAEGFPTRAGSQFPPEELAGPEADCVRRFKEAGGLVLGKTVTTEFAYFEPGPTRNPHNLSHTPGGSSSGSAAAVAAGYCLLAIGTQTIGSVVRPAAFCGVAGFKPSYGRLDPAGVLFVSRSLDHVGLFTQDMAGMQIAAPLVCKNWRAGATATHRPVLGVPEGAYLRQAEPASLAALDRQLGKLEAAGYTIRTLSTLNDIEAVAQRHVALMAGEMAREHAPWFDKYRALYRPRTLALLEQGRAVSDAELDDLRLRQAVLRVELENRMADAGIDLWATPAAPGPAPEGLGATGNPAMNLPWTQAGFPSVNLPAGRAVNGLPLGLQLVASFMHDEQLLAWAEPIAQTLNHA